MSTKAETIEPTMNRTEFAKLLETLARIAHATEALAKKADENFKTLAEMNATRPSAQVRRS
jgi:hypothetical protein